MLGWFPEARRKMVSKWLRCHDHILYWGPELQLYIWFISMYSMSLWHSHYAKGISRVRVHSTTSERIMAHGQNNTGGCLCISFCWGCCLGCQLEGQMHQWYQFISMHRLLLIGRNQSAITPAILLIQTCLCEEALPVLVPTSTYITYQNIQKLFAKPRTFTWEHYLQRPLSFLSIPSPHGRFTSKSAGKLSCRFV